MENKALRNLLSLDDKGLSKSRNVLTKTIRDIFIAVNMDHDTLQLLIEVYSRDPVNMIPDNKRRAFRFNTAISFTNDELSYKKFLELVKILGISNVTMTTHSKDLNVTNIVDLT